VRVLADASAASSTPGRGTSNADAIARGKEHQHALRILGRAWLRVIPRIWQDANRYDPARTAASTVC
jgi:hypothetical protein